GGLGLRGKEEFFESGRCSACPCVICGLARKNTSGELSPAPAGSDTERIPVVDQRTEADLVRRTDDAYQGLEWRLSRRPDHVVHIGNGYYLYKQLGYPTLRISTITVLYRFDDNEVLISAIWIFLIFKLSHY